jgi:purine-binding chemotaxis protein CheW
MTLFSLSDQKDDQYISLKIDGLSFALPVKRVQDVIYTPMMTRIPQASWHIAGLLNLRGRIVTAIDVGLMLNLRKSSSIDHNMSIILEVGNELYSFIVDSVGEVFTMSASYIEKKPSTLDDRWRQYSTGIYRIEDDLMVILDEHRIFIDLMPMGDPHE